MRKIKDIFKKLLLSHATAEEVAAGFAIGVFISATPTVPFHTVIILALTALLKKNPLAALLGGWVNNPLTFLPIYYYSYVVGGWLTPGPQLKSLRLETLQDFLDAGREVLIPLWVGGLALGLIGALASYFLVKAFYPVIQKKLRARHAP